MASRKSRLRAKELPRLNHQEILELFDQGVYKADLEEGIVYGRRGNPLHVRMGGRDRNYPKVRIHAKGRFRDIKVSHLIWVVGSRYSIPPRFEIHHKDRNREHNWYDNLFCLFEKDHEKLHRLADLIETVEEETPF